MSKKYYGFLTTNALACLCLSMPVQSQEEGFLEGSKASVNVRNYYFTRDFKGSDPTQSKSSAWTQNFILDYQSGFTKGTVGVGLDVLGTSSFKLDAGKGAGATQMLPIHDDGDPAKSYGRLGVAGKMKISKTELKVGEWMPVLPILRSDDGRSLPQTFRGGQITSREFKNWSFYGGQMRETSLRQDASMEKMAYSNGRGSIGRSNRFNFGGVEYNFNDNKTQVGVWGAQLKDVYKQGFINLKHEQPLGNWVLKANTGFFIGKEDGSKRAGNLDNRTLYGLFSANYNHHTFYAGLQHLAGDSAWMRVTGTSGGTLANDAFTTSADQPKERSWQVRYDYDFTGLNVPGLTMMIRYIKGTNVKNNLTEDGKEWARESELAYLFTEGKLKNLSIKWRYSSLRQSWNKNGRFDEHRIIVNYPISFL